MNKVKVFFSKRKKGKKVRFPICAFKYHFNQVIPKKKKKRKRKRKNQNQERNRCLFFYFFIFVLFLMFAFLNGKESIEARFESIGRDGPFTTSS